MINGVVYHRTAGHAHFRDELCQNVHVMALLDMD